MNLREIHPKAHPHQVQSSLDDLYTDFRRYDYEETKQLECLYKSPGPDKVHPRLLKLLSSSVAKPLNVIFNTSLRTGILPDDWKKAHVSAIFKKGERKHPNNYRPISLTSIVCKVLESVIRDAIFLVNHMISNDLFRTIQGGPERMQRL